MQNTSVFPQNLHNITSSAGTGNSTEYGEQTVLLAQEFIGPTVEMVPLIFRQVQGTVAFTGNFLTILIVLKYEELRDTCTHLLIASLALADMLAGIVPWLTLGESCLTQIFIFRAFVIALSYKRESGMSRPHLCFF